jgi:hypothetical protein
MATDLFIIFLIHSAAMFCQQFGGKQCQKKKGHDYNHIQQLLEEYNFPQLCILFYSGLTSMQLH